MRTLILTLAVLAAILVGCGPQDANPAPTTTETTATTPTTATEPEFDLDLEDLPEIPEDEDVLLETYRKAVRERLADSTEGFISAEEAEVFKYFGYHVGNLEGLLTDYDSMWGEEYRYYYPILFTRGSDLVLVSTDRYGSLDTDTVKGRYYSAYGDMHGPGDGDDIASYANFKLEHDTTTGEICKWVFGELTETYQVPEESVYTGYSQREGYIFRHESDVYALTEGKTWEVIPIAHGVKEVIIADYDLSSDAWSQPLFLMEDGGLKVYLGWGADELGATDHPDLLVEVQNEGGFYKTSPDPR